MRRLYVIYDLHSIPSKFPIVSRVRFICGYREESWVVPIWTMGGILTLAIILKILHLAAQHKESTDIYSLRNTVVSLVVPSSQIGSA
jgi:hypothetical protein